MTRDGSRGAKHEGGGRDGNRGAKMRTEAEVWPGTHDRGICMESNQFIFATMWDFCCCELSAVELMECLKRTPTTGLCPLWTKDLPMEGHWDGWLMNTMHSHKCFGVGVPSVEDGSEFTVIGKLLQFVDGIGKFTPSIVES